MIISKENDNAFVFKTRIEFYNREGGIEYVELREFDTTEARQVTAVGKMNKEGEIEGVSEMLERAEKFFPACVVDSSFEYEDGTKLNGKQVYDQLKKSSAMFMDILKVWLNSKQESSIVKSSEGGNPLA